MALLTIDVVQVKTGAAVTDFRFVVNEDNVGDPFASDPANWPSLRPGASHSPVVATGDATCPTVDLPPGHYLVSVLAPGHKMGGNWVALTGVDTTVRVELHPHPLPLSKIRVRVFHDNHPVNGEDDIPLESGLPGFRIVIQDAVGEVTVDSFGNPLGTQYRRDRDGNVVLDPDGNPVPVPDTGGLILTDANGEALIDNLPPGKYGVQAIPPDGTDWVQTTTIEGTHVIDAWIEEGNDGYSPREGFRVPLVWFGFVRPMEFPVPAPGVLTGTITGSVRTVVEFTPPVNPIVLGEPVDRPWIALTDIGNTDEQVYLGRGNPDGTFTIENVPPGLYQMAIWDEPLDYIISFRTVQVAAGETVAMGDVGIPRWFGWIKGTVFHDTNENGVRDPGEAGIPFVAVGTRFKDGSVQYGTVTDPDGSFSLDEVFELERFAVAELGFTRFGVTGAVAAPDANVSPPRPSLPVPGAGLAALLVAELTWAAKVNRVDWGMKRYPLLGPDGIAGTADDVTNGGITGVVYYAVMRNETDPRMAAVEDYEPGIPNVTVNLYRQEPDGSLTPVDSVQTDAWRHPADCPRPDGTADPLCLEVPNNSNQVREGLFDGGYAFLGLDPGTYVVEVVPPPGYRVLAEGTENTAEGDVFRALLMPPPYLGAARDRKVVTLESGQNAAADFFLFTDVPVPGRIVGFLLDDVNIETDPNFIYYGEKRGIPNTPVGIRDFTGKLLTTVHSDANGIFEVLLPSTYTRNVPTPSGVAPAMVQVIGNDPGDPDDPNPNYNPNYQSLKLVFDVWPGKTTYADVALFPITAFVAFPGAQFSQPPVIDLPAGTPQVHLVDPVYVTRRASRTVTLTGTGFGAGTGRVTLNGVPIPISSWTDTRIQATVPATFPAGPAQLLVTAANGQVSPTGITFHVLGRGYNPRVITATATSTIQAAIDGARDGDLIVIQPGTYYENPILYKNVKLQGMGWKRTVVDGRFFANQQQAREAKLAGIDFDGPQEIPRGQVITVLAKDGRFRRRGRFNAQIDGLTLTGARGEEGGGILINAFARHLEISNNVIQYNGGGFGGAITVGRPYAGTNHNENIRIHHNRVLNNGGISLAGAIGLFNGADDYEIAYNDIGGNYSAEYGGGISHLGLSPGGRIHHNRILFNAAFDEGGGILIGGEQPLPPATLSAGSGAVEIHANLIQGNLSNDDGGGVRLLRAGTHPVRIYNNLIVNNVATDLGGGIALDDASDVAIFNNTIAKNASTATAEDSDGLPHGAGLVSEGHSAPFQASLPPGAPDFSDPVLFNNLFWDNRAYHFDPVAGQLAPDGTVIDLEVFGTAAPRQVTPNHCYLSAPYGSGIGNIVYDGANPPGFVQEYDTVLSAVAFRREPDFRVVRIVTVTPEWQGDYHLTPPSPVVDRGVAAFTVDGVRYDAPSRDIDGDARPQGAAVDPGADEVL
ncbi:IPT/TIG domain-containing protein [Limnochorda pilosa]|uniref:Pectin esterase n=1 Tax=Limnochorda pilosa TaxID=1555112 RepID=A0A0K2SHY1_LIMPI|nr:IPT/TIG domain-containing protein [Limnochorda pilosa]BAS26726.1 pectin esterase [Limnochorda pilosa]